MTKDLADFLGNFYHAPNARCTLLAIFKLYRATLTVSERKSRDKRWFADQLTDAGYAVGEWGTVQCVGGISLRAPRKYVAVDGKLKLV